MTRLSKARFDACLVRRALRTPHKKTFSTPQFWNADRAIKRYRKARLVADHRPGTALALQAVAHSDARWFALNREVKLPAAAGGASGHWLAPTVMRIIRWIIVPRPAFGQIGATSPRDPQNKKPGL
jgi:hypothetical protein